MTTGTKIDNQLQSVMTLYEGVPLTPAWAGKYQSRVWAGTDDPVKGLTPRSYSKNYYYVPENIVTKSGKSKQIVRRKSYRVYNRNVHPRGQHEYATTRVSSVFPVGFLQSDSVNASTGSPISSGTFANTPMSLFFSSGDNIVRPILSSNDQYRAIGKLREKVVGTPFNCAVMLGEANKTFAMIGDTAIKIATSARLLKKGRVREAIDSLADPRSRKYVNRYAGNPYLQITYGWTPLLGDMKSGAESLSHRFNIPFKQEYRVRISSENSLYNGRHDALIVTDRTWAATGYSVLTRQIIAEISDSPSYLETLGFSDPASVLWELTPWSFVVDWFLPFGDWLQARSASSLLRGNFVITDRLMRSARGPFKSVFIDTGINVKNTIFDKLWLEGTSVQHVEVTRQVVSTLPVPMPTYVPLTRALSVKHCINGLALLAQVLGK